MKRIIQKLFGQKRVPVTMVPLKKWQPVDMARAIDYPRPIKDEEDAYVSVTYDDSKARPYGIWIQVPSENLYIMSFSNGDAAGQRVYEIASGQVKYDIARRLEVKKQFRQGKVLPKSA